MTLHENTPTSALGMPIIHENGHIPPVNGHAMPEHIQKLNDAQPLTDTESIGARLNRWERLRLAHCATLSDPLEVADNQIPAAAQPFAESSVARQDLPILADTLHAAPLSPPSLPRRVKMRAPSREAQDATLYAANPEQPEQTLVLPSASASEISLYEDSINTANDLGLRKWAWDQHSFIRADRMGYITEQLAGVTDFATLEGARATTNDPEIRRLVAKREYELFNQQDGTIAPISPIERLQAMLATADPEARLETAYELTKLRLQKAEVDAHLETLESTTDKEYDTQTALLERTLQGLRNL